MKQYIYLFFAIATLSACKKNNNNNPPVTPNTPTPNTPNSTYSKYISNWLGGDTLVGQIQDTMGAWVAWDTLYTKSINDTSMIVYKGIQYYIWDEPQYAADTFIKDEQSYGNLAISTTNTKAGIVSLDMFNFASPHRYKDQQGVYNHQQQRIFINDKSKNIFKSAIGYVGLRVK